MKNITLTRDVYALKTSLVNVKMLLWAIDLIIKM